MTVEIGHIQAIYRYPVKSMAGQSLERTPLGWYGIDGDRRFAFRRTAEKGGFPWLTAGRLPALLLYQPNASCTHVVTPEGKTLELTSDELRDEIIARYGAEVELMQLKQGIFDETPISLITLATCHKIAQDSDIRRFRPNIVIDTHADAPFTEDSWVGKTVIFGDAAVQVTMRDERCAMINLHPDTAQSDPAVLKTAVQLNQHCAGVYATVIRRGDLAVGHPVYVTTETVF